MVVTGSSVVRCNTPDEQALSAWSGKHALFYSYSTHIGKRERMKATHPSAVFVCASSANYMTVFYEFLNEAVFGNNRFPDGPQFDMELLSRNCTILIDFADLPMCLCGTNPVVITILPRLSAQNGTIQIIPMAFNHCNIRLCFFSTKKIYIKSRVPRNITKHQLDHLTECLFFSKQTIIHTGLVPR